MPDVVIRAAEGCDPDPFLLWDSRWSGADGFADWRMAGSDEPLNRGGLQAVSALETAVIIALFTDARVPPDHPLYYLADGDPRGWWGDGVDLRTDLFETELGSYLWLLERAPLTFPLASAARWAEHFATQALAPLISQRVVVKVEAQASANEIMNRLELVVRLYGRDQVNVYDRKFELVWNQIAT